MEGNGKTSLDIYHEGFTKFGAKGKGGKQPHKKSSEDRNTRHNSFKILEEVEENVETVQDMDNTSNEQETEAEMEDIIANNQQRRIHQAAWRSLKTMR